MIDCDPAELGRNRPLEIGLTAHVGRTLEQIIEVLPAALPNRWEEWRRRVGHRRRKSGPLDAQCASAEVPISHYRWAAEIARVVTHRYDRGG